MNITEAISKLPKARYEKYAKFLRWRLTHAEVVRGGVLTNKTFWVTFRIGENMAIRVRFKPVYVTSWVGSHGGEYSRTDLSHYEITSMAAYYKEEQEEFPADMLNYMHANPLTEFGRRLQDLTHELAGVPKLDDQDSIFSNIMLGHV